MSNINQGAMLPQMFVDGMPIGSVTVYAGNSTPPPGYLWLRKAKLKKATYATLYGILGDVFNDGSQASDEFMLPDAEGYFLRNFDNGGLTDVGRVFGSKQADALASHTHPYQAGFNAGAVLGTGGGTQGFFYTTVTSNTSAAGGTETRPKNIALNYIIKASLVYTQQQLMAAGQQFNPNPATESTQGEVKIAIQSDVDTGTDDFKAVTPKKLRNGFAASLTANGYITFPTWLGGLIFQWGTLTSSAGGDVVVPYPLTFTTLNLATFGSCYIGGGATRDTIAMFRLDTATRLAQFSVGTFLSGTRAAEAVYWFALGK